ncbi:methylated-DNA-[protein]-cysteine S-methyltransferase [Streptomyces sp. 3213]|uniref:methylated-DNA--[protein]-cysteine S-methyltransferase n=1 Tax=Streptomyces sp. 3213.3 TaxID=1855348 RepID=UPI0008971965|nr:methylated-DNA--[protein]-cysteine S-methyltransferase [Streptomyces sp. 3213.3]SEC62919.1 methylated-DNA-[protein]-cysteine S-methyltransferase [Streptomyces sp. 3213] [Streptomyces sp. 3213.3]
MNTIRTRLDSPLGELLLTGAQSPDGTTLTSLRLGDGPTIGADEHRDDPTFAEAARQLSAYFAGRLTRFRLPFTPEGTEFQQRVWRALDEIPYGTTTTYGALAERLGVPRAEVRAVGAAIGANPLLVVRPCHRVIGADGSMRGYTGGVERKVRLLTHEGALQPMLG